MCHLLTRDSTVDFLNKEEERLWKDAILILAQNSQNNITAMVWYADKLIQEYRFRRGPKIIGEPQSSHP